MAGVFLASRIRGRSWFVSTFRTLFRYVHFPAYPTFFRFSSSSLLSIPIQLMWWRFTTSRNCCLGFLQNHCSCRCPSCNRTAGI